MFMLVMQFFWKYIDDLMGKGLDTIIIIELIIYVSASLLPLALPLAMLLSSIMAIGNLAEKNELTALKSSGLSLTRILRPYILVCFVIAGFTFYFANYVIPVANYKWRALIYSVQETKIGMLLTPGAYSHQIDNYTIKVKEIKKNNEFKNITIHDMSDPNIVKTIKAETGQMFKADTGSAIILELQNGSAFEENDLKKILSKGGLNPEDFRQKRYQFESALFKITIKGFDFKKNDDELFKDAYEMYNVFQLQSVVDSVIRVREHTTRKFVKQIKQSSIYYQYKTSKVSPNQQADTVIDMSRFKNNIMKLNDLSNVELKTAYTNTLNNLRASVDQLESQKSFLSLYARNLNSYYIEFHRKFALTVAIIILFFIGAPLGAIVKKGGFGAPVVVAALLFMIYFVLISIGDSLADQGVTTPVFGMWMPSIVMLPFAMILMYSASNDLPINSWSTFRRIFKRKKKK